MRKINHLRHFLHFIKGSSILPSLRSDFHTGLPEGGRFPSWCAADAGRAESGLRCGIVQISSWLISRTAAVPVTCTLPDGCRDALRPCVPQPIGASWFDAIAHRILLHHPLPRKTSWNCQIYLSTLSFIPMQFEPFFRFPFHILLKISKTTNTLINK